jgi:23S rRNA (cytidine1920-2'-O)/16S rRNA (cytidine1409-2'-O)-methyltransferase
MRADQLLVERGLAASRSQAQRLIASGVRWRMGAAAYQVIKKNGDELPPQAEVVLDDASEVRYVSRGGLKLESALRDTGLDVRGWRCLDVGQSTGGFTDALLHAGAASVVGIDVGHGQLHPRILQHPQVQCIQGLNARDLQPLDTRLKAEGGFDLVVGDVSFISLTLVLPSVVAQLKPQGHLLMLVKPQFELQPGQLGKGGLVKDNALHEQVRLRIVQACQDLGLRHLHWLASAITGGDGNHEFFVHAQCPANLKVPT